MYKIYTFCFILLFQFAISAQSIDWKISISENKNIHLPAMQSFVFAEYKDYWIFIGGRIDGLHRKQPFAAFDLDGRQSNIFVYSKLDDKLIELYTDSCDTSIQEQLASTNMQYAIRGNQLFITGGYGYHKAIDDNITFPYLSILDLDKIITYQTNRKIEPKDIMQFNDSMFKVCGGNMVWLGDTCFIIGGHAFDGSYNPIGNPTFVQKYNEKITGFKFDTKTYEKVFELEDTTLLHKRDNNVLVVGNDLFIYSGVFRKNNNIPFTNVLKFTNGKLEELKNFRQLQNQYHCANTMLHDNIKNAHYAIFFGGLGMYHFSQEWNYDTDAPFTNTISIIEQNNNNYYEYTNSEELPEFIGTAGHFIPHQNNDIDIQKINNKIKIGFLVGGIQSSSKNIFWTQDGSESKAMNTIYDVYLEKTNIEQKPIPLSNSRYQLDIIPNSNFNNFDITIHTLGEPYQFDVFNSKNKIIFRRKQNNSSTKIETFSLNKKVAKQKKFKIKFTSASESFEYWMLNND